MSARGSTRFSRKRVCQAAIATLLLGSLTIQADPFRLFSWDNATTYENGQPIPIGDLTTTAYCSATQGGPYDIPLLPATDAEQMNWDLAPLVITGPGVYYCVTRHTSAQYGTESVDSNEVNFTVDAAELGFVPGPPTNFRL